MACLSICYALIFWNRADPEVGPDFHFRTIDRYFTLADCQKMAHRQEDAERSAAHPNPSFKPEFACVRDNGPKDDALFGMK